MFTLTALLTLSLPTVLVCAAWFTLRRRPSRATTAIWLIVGLAWAIAIWFWISYGRQQDDVGLMVEGIIAAAMSTSALIATIVSGTLTWRSSNPASRPER